MAQLFYDSVHAVCANDYTQEQLDVWATGDVDLEKWNKSFSENTTLIAQEGGVILGFADMDSSGYLDRLYVHKDFQGKGIAKKLVNSLETMAKNKGITKFVASTLDSAEGFCNYAVAARDKQRAQAFAKKYNFKKAYGSYEEMLQDPEVDLVYIATTTSHHYEHAMLCLKHKKPVICEKSFTANLAQAQEVIEAFERENIFITEAIWPRYVPFTKTLKQLLAEGVVGTPRLLTANLGYPVSHIERVYKPELAGGALLDIGVYTLNFASMIFGDDVVSTTSSAVLTQTGVDEHSSITLTYPDGRLAVLCNSMSVRTDRQGIIYGSEGMLVVDNINNPVNAKLYSTDQEFIKEFNAPKQISGYEYQFEASRQAMEKGLLECSDMPHSETLLMMQWMEDLLQEWGVKRA
ncbi:hypothetical protein AAG570_014180 [Ranatra chinensis]|uniref:Trans-1,2-dihydrobenzene-1,2-diol dehydrogenase n=1 Tax=Ranatra chinensis TaxID=642074 RepID=A0ABD0XTM0_9HEMI